MKAISLQPSSTIAEASPQASLLPPPVLLYGCAVFLSAFLLFQVQPLAAKSILPWFGGASSVWTTCMLFFQGMLLAGYAYAHWLQRWNGRRQAAIHLALIACACLLLPPLPGQGWKHGVVDHPLRSIPLVLAASAGLPYFLLAATSPLLQSWFARTHPGRSPYRLFALSNAGSMLALLTYPILVEPFLSVGAQGIVWSLAFGGFAAAVAVVARRAGALVPSREEHAAAGAGPSRADRALWLALPATASALLLATTTYITQDVAAIPFLWVLPLALYLLSFILCFDAPRYYRRPVYMPLLAAALGGMAWLLSPYGDYPGMLAAIALSAASLFVFCMVCHGELARLKPAPAHLTNFYLTLSAGGACGGLFVGLAAPTLFNAYHELPIGLAACAMLAGAVLARAGLRRWVLAAVAATVLAYAGFLGHIARDPVAGCLFAARNFYGQVRVTDSDDEDGMGTRRKLYHGRINHGEQLLAPLYRNVPGNYFCPEAGIGQAMAATAAARAPRRIGVLGLGAGVLAAYGRAGDMIRIYEINPLVFQAAATYFTYLRDTPARIEQVLGDGRLALEREAAQGFDLLVMDAFSGDSIPTHLVTREAFATYFRHLRPGGILAVNISNRYVDLRPLMERAASGFGRVGLHYPFTALGEDTFCLDNTWALLVEPSSPLAATGARLERRPDFRMWTDNYSNMFGVLK